MGLPRTDDKKYFSDLNASMDSIISGINKQARQFTERDTLNKPDKNKYNNVYEQPFNANDLYEEIKRAACEIFSTDDFSGSYKKEMYEFIIRYGVLFSAIATPALLKYFNSKMQIIYEELNKSVESKMLELERTLELKINSANTTV